MQFWLILIITVKPPEPHLMICRMSVDTLPNMFHFMCCTWTLQERMVILTETKNWPFGNTFLSPEKIGVKWAFHVMLRGKETNTTMQPYDLQLKHIVVLNQNQFRWHVFYEEQQSHLWSIFATKTAEFDSCLLVKLLT